MAPARTKSSSEGRCPRRAAEISGMPVVLGPTAARPTRASRTPPRPTPTPPPAGGTARPPPPGGAGGGPPPAPGPPLDLGVGAGPVRSHREPDLGKHLPVLDGRLV